MHMVGCVLLLKTPGVIQQHNASFEVQYVSYKAFDAFDTRLALTLQLDFQILEVPREDRYAVVTSLKHT